MRFKIYFIFIIILFVSCKKNEPTPEVPTNIFQPGPQTKGWVKAKKNGLAFEASAFVEPDINSPIHMYLWFLTYSSEGLAREYISFNKILYQTKEFNVKGDVNLIYDGYVGSSLHGLISDGDVTDRKYLVDESTQNTLTITEIDTVQNIVRGTFDVSYIRVEPDESDVYPLNIHFSEGEFEVAF